MEQDRMTDDGCPNEKIEEQWDEPILCGMVNDPESFEPSVPGCPCWMWAGPFSHLLATGHHKECPFYSAKQE